MKNLMKNLLAAFIFIGMTGCSTIYFHNNSTDTQTSFEEWHHDGIFGLVEFSDPIDSQDRCKGASWKTIKVEETFIQGLVRGVTWSLYDPWMMSYSCVKPAASSAAVAAPTRAKPRRTNKAPMKKSTTAPTHP